MKIEKSKLIATTRTHKNETQYPDFVLLCKMQQSKLKDYLTKWLENYYAKDEIISEDGFLYARGNEPILLTAHMDTVHKVPVKDFYEIAAKGIHTISSPQGIGGDDRCGIYMIQKIIENTGLKPSILFCEDEERGGIGSDKFCKTKYIKEIESMLFLIELDRANAKDVVYYDDGNETFHNFVEVITGYKEAFGSFSDISNLSPACGVSSVNISCGYYKAHTTDEYVVMEDMEQSINKTIDLIEEGLSRNEHFEFEECLWGTSGYGMSEHYKYETEYMVVFYTSQDKEYFYEGYSFEDCVGQFLMEHPNLKWGDVTDYEIF